MPDRNQAPTITLAGVRFATAVGLPSGEPQYTTVGGVRYVVGKPQQIFPRGRSVAIDGREVILDDRNGPALVADFRGRGVMLAITYDHENDKARGSEAAGWAGDLEWRQDGLWATSVLWTLSGYEAISTGKFRYVSGDCYAEGDPEKGEPAYPVRMKAFSLVPIPALQNGLQPIALATLEGLQPKTGTTPPAQPGKKERKMDEATMTAVLKALGCSPESSPEEIKAAAEKLAAAAADPSQEPDGDEGCDHCEACAGVDGCTNHEAVDQLAAGLPKPAAVPPPAPVKTGAKKMEKPNVNGLVSQVLAAAEKRMADKFAADLERVETRLKADAEAAAKKDRIQTLVLAAIKDRKIDAAEKDRWTRRLELDFDGEKGVLDGLAARPASVAAAFASERFAAKARVTGGEQSMPDFARMDNEERSYWMNRTLTLAASRNIAADKALRLVLAGEGQEEYDAIEHARLTGSKYRGCGFRPKALSLAADFDLDKFQHARKKLAEGNGTGTAVSDEFRQLVNQRFATIAGLQPGAMTTIPATIGYAEPDYIGMEILDEFVGGATLNANVFTFGQERFYVKTDAAGNPVATAPTADPNRTDFNVTPSTITLKAYSDQILIDRMLQDAAVALPEGLMGIAAKHIQSQTKVRREVAAANFLRTYTNYAAGNYDTLSGTRQWDQDTGLPITDISNAMLTIEGVVGQPPDVAALSSKTFTGMRRNKQIVEYVKFTGTMGRPGTMVPVETLVALFGVKFLIGRARHTTVPGGTPSQTWGQDFVLAVTGKGEISAPRFGYFVTAAGYPLTQNFPMNFNGPAGSDAIQVADAFAIQAGLNTAGYLFLNATNLP